MYRKGLAKVSQTPGKTATINFYDVDGTDFVDLPGYGYAKVAKSEKGRWSELIEGYFNQDRRFALVVSLVDIRHDPSALDMHMAKFLWENDFPFAIALTKADKLSKQAAGKQASAIRKKLDLPKDIPFVVTSSSNGTGIDELATPGSTPTSPKPSRQGRDKDYVSGRPRRVAALLGGNAA